MADSQEKKRVDRSELWATVTTLELHASRRCCNPSHWPRKQVKDHENPSYFDRPEFTLCRSARVALQEEGS